MKGVHQEYATCLMASPCITLSTKIAEKANSPKGSVLGRLEVQQGSVCHPQEVQIGFGLGNKWCEKGEQLGFLTGAGFLEASSLSPHSGITQKRLPCWQREELEDTLDSLKNIRTASLSVINLCSANPRATDASPNACGGMHKYNYVGPWIIGFQATCTERVFGTRASNSVGGMLRLRTPSATGGDPKCRPPHASTSNSDSFRRCTASADPKGFEGNANCSNSDQRLQNENI